MVDFIFLGPSKTASTWIFEAMRAHPGLFVPPSKDIYFFDRYFDKGVGWYEAFFKGAQEGSVCGELSHDYFSSRIAIRRIHAYNPQIKLICCLRNPFERAYSSYLHLVRVGLFSGPFEAALRELPFIVDEGRYYTNLRHVFSLFHRESVLVLDFDELEAAPEAFARRIYRFLGVDEAFVPPMLRRKINPARTARSIALAGFAKQAALRVRRWGYPNVVGRVKHSRFANWLLYRPEPAPADKPRQAAAAPDYLVHLYRSELDELSRLLDTDYSKWEYSNWRILTQHGGNGT